MSIYNIQENPLSCTNRSSLREYELDSEVFINYKDILSKKIKYQIAVISCDHSRSKQTQTAYFNKYDNTKYYELENHYQDPFIIRNSSNEKYSVDTIAIDTSNNNNGIILSKNDYTGSTDDYILYALYDSNNYNNDVSCTQNK